MVANEKQKKKRKEKSWSLSPGGLTLIRAISARLDISRPVYTWRPLHIYWAGWAAGRPCISFQVLERSPLGWIYIHIRTFWWFFFFLSTWMDEQPRKEKEMQVGMEWSWKKEYRKQELDEGVRPPNDQSHQSRNNKDKTRDFPSIWLLFVRGFLVEGLLRSDTYYTTSILPIVSFSFLFNYLRENIRTGINAGDHHHVHRSSFRTCLKNSELFFFLFFYFLFSSLFWARRGEGPLAPTGSYSNSAP